MSDVAFSGAFDGTLPDTATHDLRVWVYEPAAPGDYPDARVGTLGIACRKRRANGDGPWEEDRYAVELDPQTGLVCLTNESDPKADRPYFWRPGQCDCDAGRFGKPCKHEHALRAAARKGAFRGPVRAPAPRPEPEPEAVPVGAPADPADPYGYRRPLTPCPF